MKERTPEIAKEYLEHYKRAKYGMMPEWVWDMAIKALEQTPKTGHWMRQVIGYRCSNCTLCTNEKGRLTYNYCPNCGCRMVEPHESEEV